MTTWILIFLSILINISLVSSLSIMGPYRARFLSATKDASIVHPAINATVRMKKMSKMETGLFLELNALQDIGPIWLTFKYERYGAGGYKNWMINEALRGIACRNYFFKKTIDDYGLGKNHLSEDCIAHKGKIEIRNLLLDKEMHKIRDIVTYGQFKITSSLTEQDGTPLATLIIELIYEPI